MGCPSTATGALSFRDPGRSRLRIGTKCPDPSDGPCTDHALGSLPVSSPTYRPLCCALERVSCCWGRTEHIIIIGPLLHPLIPPLSTNVSTIHRKIQPKIHQKTYSGYLSSDAEQQTPRVYLSSLSLHPLSTIRRGLEIDQPPTPLPHRLTPSAPVARPRSGLCRYRTDRPIHLCHLNVQRSRPSR